jgi:hypothetical protein
MTGGKLVDTLLDAAIKEIPRLGSSLILLLLAWLIGQGLTVKWNLRQKRREFDLATEREFHTLYGDFFAIWKLWNYYVQHLGPEALPGASRWELLKRACEAEGKLEANLVRISCNRPLSADVIKDLGIFRQLYQSLRESIRDGKPLDWGSSEHPDYVEFKRLAPEIAGLIVAADAPRVLPGKAAATLQKITSNKWERPTVAAKRLQSFSQQPLPPNVPASIKQE